MLDEYISDLHFSARIFIYVDYVRTVFVFQYFCQRRKDVKITVPNKYFTQQMWFIYSAI